MDNKKLKEKILRLYKKNKLELTEELKYKLLPTTKTRYNTLLSIYEDYKDNIKIQKYRNNLTKTESEAKFENLLNNINNQLKELNNDLSNENLLSNNSTNEINEINNNYNKDNNSTNEINNNEINNNDNKDCNSTNEINNNEINNNEINNNDNKDCNSTNEINNNYNKDYNSTNEINNNYNKDYNSTNEINYDNIIKELKTNFDNSNNEIKELKTVNFNLLNENKDLKNSVCNYKKIIASLNKMLLDIKNNTNTNKKCSDNEYYSDNSNSSSNDSFKNKKINYHDIPKLGIYNLIKILTDIGYDKNEIETKSKHELKQLYNRYYCNKYNRIFKIKHVS